MEYNQFEQGCRLFIIRKPKFIEELENNKPFDPFDPLCIGNAPLFVPFIPRHQEVFVAPARQSGKMITEFKRLLDIMFPTILEYQKILILKELMNPKGESVIMAKDEDMLKNGFKNLRLNEPPEIQTPEELASSEETNADIIAGYSDAELHKRIKYAKNPLERKRYERLLNGKCSEIRHHKKRRK